MTLSTDLVLAPVLEVFASIQGEGLHVGRAQVFLRLRGCPMRCAWCDTPGSWELHADDRVRVATSEGQRKRPGWATPFQVACWVSEVEPGEPRTVSVTGGEPLLWPSFLLELPSMLGSRPLHLETAGGHPRTLERVAHVFQHVSLDLKLPADLNPPVELPSLPPADLDGESTMGLPTVERAPRDEQEWRAARRACLTLLAGRDAAAKVVVAGGRKVGDFAPLLEDLAHLAPEMPLILQPVTAVRGVTPPAPVLLQDLVEDARDLGLDVRVVPQVHRILGIP